MHERQIKPVIGDSFVAVAPTATTVGAFLFLDLIQKSLRFFPPSSPKSTLLLTIAELITESAKAMSFPEPTVR